MLKIKRLPKELLAEAVACTVDEYSNYLFLHTFFEPFSSAYHNKTPDLACCWFLSMKLMKILSLFAGN